MSDEVDPELTGEITDALRAWRRDRTEGEERLIRLVYHQLRSMADAFLRGERRGHTLQPTELVHEAYLRLLEQRRVDWQSRNHFFAIAARVMRRILVDHARGKQRLKRGGGLERVPIDHAADMGLEEPPGLVALDDALSALSEIDRLKAAIVELRYFGGFTSQETAEVLEIAESTVRRHWRLARAWLYRELTGDSAGEA